MANAIYPKYKAALLDALANVDIVAGNIKAILFDVTDDPYDAANEFLSDLVAGAIVATSPNLTTKTVVGGTFDCDNWVWSAVTGDPCEAVIIYIDTGTGTTSRLIAWLDNGITGLPVTPNGGDINFTVDAAGLFTL